MPSLMLNLELKMENTAETGVCPVPQACLAAFLKSISTARLTTSFNKPQRLNLKANWGMERNLHCLQIRSPDRICSGFFPSSRIMQRMFPKLTVKGFLIEKRSFPERRFMANLQGPG